MNYCSTCGQGLQAGAAFCANCGTATSAQPSASLSAQQGLAQAGLEVQQYNAVLIVGRLIGLAAAVALVWFVVGPVLGPDGALVTIVAFLVLAFLGIVLGQWAALKVMRG